MEYLNAYLIDLQNNRKCIYFPSGKIEYLLQALSKDSKEIHLRVPIGRGYAYRHHPAFDGKSLKVIADIDV